MRSGDRIAVAVRLFSVIFSNFCISKHWRSHKLSGHDYGGGDDYEGVIMILPFILTIPPS
eukprot:1155665-Karenia_brevis.AAC.1